MADVIKKVNYFKAQVSNRPGVGASVLETLKEEGVNLLAFTGFPRGGKAQIDFIPEDAAAFKKAAKKAGLKLSAAKAGFLIQGEDRPGAVADIAAKLAEAKINITAVDAISAGDGCFAAILWVKPADVRKTERLLKAA
jgi:hypothetical protein